MGAVAEPINADVLLVRPLFFIPKEKDGRPTAKEHESQKHADGNPSALPGWPLSSVFFG